jgi:hypothetical protein
MNTTVKQLRAAEINDIVQITDEGHHWFPSLIVVSELKLFGIQGFAFIPANDCSPAGQAYIRISASQYEVVGKAAIVPFDAEQSEVQDA